MILLASDWFDELAVDEVPGDVREPEPFAGFFAGFSPFRGVLSARLPRLDIVIEFVGQ